MKASNNPEQRVLDGILLIERCRPNSAVFFLCLVFTAFWGLHRHHSHSNNHNENEGMSIHEIDATTIVNTSNPSVSSFPHWTESFGDGGSRIAYELYRFWDEDLEVVSPQPFSYLLYGDGLHFWKTGVEGCTCSDNRSVLNSAKTLGEALECCAGTKEDQDLLSFMDIWYDIDSVSESYVSYGWHAEPCQEVYRHHSNCTETNITWANENIPFANGQMYGNATEFDTVYIADPTSDSCWYFSCSLYLPHDHPETCVELLQINLRLASLEEFVGAIKDLTTND